MKRCLLAVRLALAALSRNRLHASLTALGIVIGTAAVVVIAHGAGSTSEKILADVDGLISSDSFVLNPEAPDIARPGPGLTEADAKAIESEVDAVAAVATYVDTRASVRGEARRISTRVSGVTLEYFAIRGFHIARGRAWRGDEETSRSNVCVLGSEPARRLFPGGLAVGHYVRVAGLPFKVIGVLLPRGGPSGNDQDDRILLPLSSFRARVERTTTGRVDAIFIKAKSPELVGRAALRADELLRSRHRIRPGEARDYRVTTQLDLRRSQEEISRTLSLLLVGVAGISLLAGGAGVMNVMLGSVAERTYEIGVRLSIGARTRDILGQFLTEAVVVAGLGGLCGVSLGAVGSVLLAQALGVPFRADPIAMLGAASVSIAIGLVFGIVPAHRAAHIDPIEALRSR